MIDLSSIGMDLPVGTRPLAIAHRGSRLLWHENTMPAFQGAVDLGYRWLETDLHLTSDGVLVCLHDDTLDRTTDGTGPVWERRSSDLATVDAGYRFEADGDHPWRGRQVRVPTLEEVVTTFPDVSLVVDLKQDGLEEPLVELSRRLRLTDRLVVGSFADRRLRNLRRLAPPVATSMGPVEAVTAWARSWVGTPRTAARAFQVPRKYGVLSVVNPRTVAGMHRAGVAVHVWTVDDEPEMIELIEMGVDGIITDRPDVLRRVLMERGWW